MTWLLFFDQLAFRLINQGISNPFLDQYMPWITDFHRNPLFLVLLAGILGHFVIRFRFNFWKPFVYILLAIGISDAIAYRVIKPLVDRPRPSHVEEMKTVLRVDSKGGLHSFPSNHAANTFALAMALSFISPWWITPAFAIAIVVGFSRIYVGVHYPLDVLAGALLGMGAAWALWVALFHIWIVPKKKTTSKKAASKKRA